MMKCLKNFNENISDETKIVFTYENNLNIEFNIYKSRNDRITKIENEIYILI